MTHQAIFFERFGGPEVLQSGAFEDRPLGPRDVRLDVAAFALNRADLMYLHGEHYTIPEFPARIGSEASGIVTEVGADVSELAVGDRVATIPFFTQDGVQGTSAVFPADYVVPVPGDLDDVHACAVWMQYLTPYMAFKEVRDLGRGDVVLVTAAASSAGLGALQLCRELEIATVATTRSAAKADLLRASGATAVVVGDDDLSAAIAEVSGGRGIDAAFDPIAGDSLSRYVDDLAPGATVFGYGTLSDEQPVIPVAAMCRAGAVFHPYSLFNHIGIPDQRRRGVELISKAVAGGSLRPRVDRVFGFADALDAYRYMESNAQAGKIVVTTGA
ncbi:zinc-dependent alcohol dehydrogenase family protein [Pimelobacter sp. 30-1]|uniref:zinc-dependent alcohol dehydrogenase family protein n=1 Tax=Pimelobacter TaxID=2044 RepID=UPI001C046E17|nr:zinc-dependent alcohol dehydrogenase family protein [Pimelobacter sp. 30-1]MBU2694464.1 hypothetical protein [Pimelobacter sp. 30-1]